MRSAPLLRAVLALALIGACASRTSSRGDGALVHLKGATAGAVLDASATAEIAEGDAESRFVLVLVNHGEEPVGVELDSVVVRDEAGTNHRVLGRLQRYVARDGSRGEQRSPYGPSVVEPRARAKVALDFGPLPLDGELQLLVPRLYRLGIEGQVQLEPLTLPLKARAPASPDLAAFDPFEE